LQDPLCPRHKASLSAFIDTNLLIRHLTGDPPEMAARATAYLSRETELLLTDLVVAETVYVLESFYEVPREQVAESIRALLAMSSMVAVDTAVLLRSIEVYESERLDFAEAYLVACAESTGINVIASFDKSIERVGTVKRVEPRNG
jgi:predicted nucleic acid-binding protein